jgi:alpha-mannosidase/mannosylglycerate hydrolase
VPLEITSWVTLKAGQPWLDVRCEVENTARDHRLRVLFPTHLPVKQYAADGAYDVVWRDVALRADNHTLWEPEVETKPQATWTAVNDGKRGLAIIASGQPESSVRDLPDRPIALTLFRGFARTVGTAGEPDGQMLGRTSHRFWVYPHQGALPGPELCRLGQRLAGGMQCIYTDRSRLPLLNDKPRLPASGSWLKSGPGPLVITACKAAEDGQALIVRVFNPTDKAARQKLEFFTPVQSAHTVDLLEQPQTSLAARGNSITVVAEGRQIVTLRVVLRRVV